MADIDNNKSIIPLSQAVETIKTAILQGQYEANKDVNRIQLAVYFAIGKYLSKNTRNLEYGSGAIKAISDQLLREMPGLRGYSETSLKNMRKFYDAWQILDIKSSVATDESQSTITIAESSSKDSAIAIADFQNTQNQIDIYHSICIPNAVEFPAEDFFATPFTHHIRLIEGVKDLHARYYYLHRISEEKLPVDQLVKLIKEKVKKNSFLKINNMKNF